ncbi:NADAR family protein [Candidatus Kaiserbacteria bacterium]|nr:NADAR family protein [Candidatus Kaiserbacteria bacterium]
MERILFYEGPWYLFSNFSAFAVHWRGEDWSTVEHAYQAAKFGDERIRSHIRIARSAHEAKKLARAYHDYMRRDWQDVKLGIMEEILRVKLAQHLYVRQQLLETGDAEIVEDSPKDSFWGRGPDWQGENHLGRLWMKLREELRRAAA